MKEGGEGGREIRKETQGKKWEWEGRREERGESGSHHQFKSALKLVTDGWFFKNKTQRYVLGISETNNGDSSGLAQFGGLTLSSASRGNHLSFGKTRTSARGKAAGHHSHYRQPLPAPLEPQGRGKHAFTDKVN